MGITDETLVKVLDASPTAQSSGAATRLAFPQSKVEMEALAAS